MAAFTTLDAALNRRSQLGHRVLKLTGKDGELTSEEWFQLRVLSAEMDALKDDPAIESERRYDSAFSKYVNDRPMSREESAVFAERERRDMTTDTAPGLGGNGPLAPLQFGGQVVAMMRATDHILRPDVSTVVTSGTGGAGGFPNMDDTQSAATIVTPGAQGSMDEPTLGQVAFGVCPTLRSGISKLSIEMDKDSGIDHTEHLARSFGVRLARGIGTSIVVPKLLAAAQRGVTASGSASNSNGSETGATSVGTDDLHDLLATVNEAYLASPKCYWAMRHGTYLTLLRVKDVSGRPVIREMYNGAGEPMLLGKPIAFCPSLDAIATGKKPILVGDFSRLIIRMPGGLRVQRLTERFAVSGQIGLQAFMRADAGVQITIPSGSPPVTDSPIKFLQCA